MAVGTAIAAGAGATGGLLTTALNQINEWQNRGWSSQKDYEDYRADYEKAISDYFLNKQMDYNTYMSNTAYQRAIADMQAAGLNPAAMAGVNANAASTPNASGVQHSGMKTNAQVGLNSANAFGNAMASLANSAIYSTIAKDHDAAKLLASEIVDNARHAHHMEELREKHELNRENDSIKNNLNLSKAIYYDDLAAKIRGY